MRTIVAALDNVANLSTTGSDNAFGLQMEALRSHRQFRLRSSHYYLLTPGDNQDRLIGSEQRCRLMFAASQRDGTSLVKETFIREATDASRNRSR